MNRISDLDMIRNNNFHHGYTKGYLRCYNDVLEYVLKCKNVEELWDNCIKYYDSSGFNYNINILM